MAGGTASGSGYGADERAKEVRRVRLNVTLYRLMAYVTGVVLIVLCVLAIMQAFVNDEAAVNAVPQAAAAHGADRRGAAGRHHPGDDVHRGTLGQPPVHRAGPGRRHRRAEPARAGAAFVTG
jgi:hypothetical protein